MEHHTIRRGAWPARDPSPGGLIEDAVGIQSVALLGEDWPGLRPGMEVEVGARVARGQVLFRDRKHPEVCFVAPVSGVVDTLTYGARRRLDVIVIRIEEEGSRPIARPDGSPKRASREALLAAGFWPSFRTRPYGRIPVPNAMPEAIVINAVRAAPQAPDPVTVLGDRLEAFRAGCDLLTTLTGGEIYLCQSPGSELGPEHDRVRHASFSGSTAAGLAGTQIDRLCPGRDVWSIGYQDVAAIGHFIATGEYYGQCVVSVSGPMAQTARLLRVPRGARLADLESGGQGVTATGPAAMPQGAAFLGYFEDHLRLLPNPPHNKKPSTWWRRSGHSASIPTRGLETSIAIDVPSVPLLRALSIGDAETAERLGCLALVEEDLAVATHRCTSGIDYGACLRHILSELSADMV